MLPPGPRTPAFVQTLRWIYDPADAFVELFHRYGETFTVRSAIFGIQVVFTRPEHLKEIFTADSDTLNGAEANRPLEVFIGPRSLLVLEGAAHLARRRLMLPAFHGERMRCYTETMRDLTLRAASRWRAGDRVGLLGVMQEITLDVILHSVLGLSSGPEIEQAHERLRRLLARIQSPWGALWTLPALRKNLGPLTPWAGIQREIDQTDAMVLAHIAKKRATPARSDDVLSMLLDAVDEGGRGMEDRELRDQLFTLLVAGHETSATSIAWAFEEILRAPGEQDRLIDEATSVVGDGPLQAEHLPRLTRLDAAIKEALRLHPVTGAVGRRLMKAARIGGIDLPAGVLVVAGMRITHRRPDLYPDPERFDPARFLGRKIDPYEWLPFGGGDRRCLGMAFALYEMKTIMATLFASRIRLRLESSGRAETQLRSILYAPKGGTRVVVERAPAQSSVT